MIVLAKATCRALIIRRIITTDHYDAWHAAAPWIPSISSETCSTMSDRGELNNATAGTRTALPPRRHAHACMRSRRAILSTHSLSRAITQSLNHYSLTVVHAFTRSERVRRWVAAPAAGHVSCFGQGQSADSGWGGVGEPDGQGILTRAFISGGWTWTGWDYRGEPTP